MLEQSSKAMDRDLLEKYLSGNCTPEEVQQVEQWLNSADDETAALTNSELSDMDSDIWASLSEHLEKPKVTTERFVLHPAFRFSVAASLCIGLALMLSYFFRANKPASINFTAGIHANQFRSATTSLDFYLKPHSRVKGELKRRRGNLDFSGSLEMVSSSAGELLIDFNAQSAEFSSGRRVKIQPKQTYYVGVLSQQHVPDEILVLNAEQVQDLPPRIRIMAFKDYSI